MQGNQGQHVLGVKRSTWNQSGDSPGFRVRHERLCRPPIESDVIQGINPDGVYLLEGSPKNSTSTFVPPAPKPGPADTPTMRDQVKYALPLARGGLLAGSQTGKATTPWSGIGHQTVLTTTVASRGNAGIASTSALLVVLSEEFAIAISRAASCRPFWWMCV